MEHYFDIRKNSGRVHAILKKNGVPTEHHVLKGDHPDAQLDDLGIGKWRNIPFLAIGSERFLRPAGQCPAFVFPARQRPGFSRFRHMRFLS